MKLLTDNVLAILHSLFFLPFYSTLLSLQEADPMAHIHGAPAWLLVDLFQFGQ